MRRYGKPKRFNSEQGNQFISFVFTGVLISMDGRVRCMDNIFIERLWRSFKYKAVHPHEPTDGFLAERAIAAWIAFCNIEQPNAVKSLHH